MLLFNFLLFFLPFSLSLTVPSALRLQRRASPKSDKTSSFTSLTDIKASLSSYGPITRRAEKATTYSSLSDIRAALSGFGPIRRRSEKPTNLHSLSDIRASLSGYGPITKRSDKSTGLLHSLSDIKASLSSYGPISRRWGYADTSGCKRRRHYNITSEAPLRLDPLLITGASCNGSYSTCAMGTAIGYAVTFTIAAGVDLSVSELAGIGVHADVAYSQTNSLAVAVSVNCPQSFTCGLQAVATLWNVSGWRITNCSSSGCCEKPTYEPYEVHLPIILSGASKENQAMVEYGPCIERGSVNSFRRPPSIPLCPEQKAPIYKGGKQGIITG